MDVNSNKLLIVDHDPMARKYTRNLAMKLDYDIEESDSVSEALTYIEKFSPSLIVLDLNLADTDGIEMLTQLAKIKCTAAIVILSSLERAILESAKTVGQEIGLQILGISTKPVFPAEIVSWLKLAQVGRPVVSDQVVWSALENDEFSLHYQPTFSRKGNLPWSVSGVAAYIRWNHPELGILRPGQFLEAVEQTGLLPELTDRAILDAIQHVRYWQTRGMSLAVGVTIPWHLITDSGMPERLETLTREADINPNRLILNISDISDSQNSIVGREVLARLRLKEFQLAYDGFKDLRSSINHLVTLPFTIANLDSSFAALANFDKDVASTAGAIVAIGQELGIEVHAKSVENQQELEALEKLGCRSAQGNIFCPVLPGSQVESFVRQWNKAAIRPTLELARTGNW